MQWLRSDLRLLPWQQLIQTKMRMVCVFVFFSYNFKLVLISIVKLLNVEALIPGGGGGWSILFEFELWFLCVFKFYRFLHFSSSTFFVFLPAKCSQLIYSRPGWRSYFFLCLFHRECTGLRGCDITCVVEPSLTWGHNWTTAASPANSQCRGRIRCTTECEACLARSETDF